MGKSNASTFLTLRTATCVGERWSVEPTNAGITMHLFRVPAVLAACCAQSVQSLALNKDAALHGGDPQSRRCYRL